MKVEITILSPSTYANTRYNLEAELLSKSAAYAIATVDASKIIDAAIPTDTASGAIASFPDGAGDLPVKSLVVNIEPVQDLHGYANPWPGGGGKNLCPYFITGTASGLTFTVADDGSVKVTGTNQETAFKAIKFTLSAGTYILSGAPSGGQLTIRDALGGSSPSVEFSGGFDDYGNGSTFTVSATASAYLNIRVVAGTHNETYYPMIRKLTDSSEYSPYSNTCTISGWTGCEVVRTGKNLLPDSNEVTKTAESGVQTTYCYHDMSVYLKAGVTYTFSCNQATSAGTVTRNLLCVVKTDYYTPLVYESSNSGNAHRHYVTYTPTESGYYSPAYWAHTLQNAITLTEFQCEVGGSFTSYESYSGTTIQRTYTDSLGNTLTVYGGVDDVTGGVLTQKLALLGSITWAKHSSYSHVFYGPATTGQKQTGEGYSNELKLVNTGTLSAFASDSEYRLRIGDRIYINIPAASNTTELETWLTSNPLQIVFELATPIEYTLTPDELTTLYGQNNVWNTAGNTEVAYLCDVQKYIDKKIAQALNA